MTFTWKNALHSAGLASLLLVTACSGPKTDEGAAPAAEAAKQEFDIGWSIYAGWMPWPYAEKSGILKKWADKYGIKINLIQVNDYVESVNQYTAGKLDGVGVTNMDALTIPAAGGKDTTLLIMGDYSNGNDGIVIKGPGSVSSLKGQTVNLVELSVSHYLLARALEMNGMKLADVKTVNTSDADIVGAFGTSDVKAVAAWNPQLAEIRKATGATQVFSSAQIPNEIQDVMSVSTETLKANPALGKALVGAWFEVLGIMAKGDAESGKAIAEMARLSGTDTANYQGQLKTTFLYYKPADAAAYVSGSDVMKHMDGVRQFSFAKGLFGPNATSVDAIGIEFPGGKVLGDKNNIKLRYDASFMQMAADGKL
ncbi:MAG: putative urea ABC transporter substrate-binding protein [Pseudomonadota bacterium]